MVVLLSGGLIDSLAGTLIDGLIGGMIGIGSDALNPVSVSVVAVALSLEDILLVSYAGDVRTCWWGGRAFDMKMSLGVRVGVIGDVWIEVLAYTAIGVVPNIDMLADTDADIWPALMAVLDFISSPALLEWSLLFR